MASFKPGALILFSTWIILIQIKFSESGIYLPEFNTNELPTDQNETLFNTTQNTTENIFNDQDQVFNNTIKESIEYTSELDNEILINKTKIPSYEENILENDTEKIVIEEIETTHYDESYFLNEKNESNKNIETNSSFQDSFYLEDVLMNVTQDFNENITNGQNKSEEIDQVLNGTIEEPINSLKNNLSLEYSDQQITDIFVTNSSYPLENLNMQNLTENETKLDIIIESTTNPNYIISNMEYLNENKSTNSIDVKPSLNYTQINYTNKLYNGRIKARVGKDFYQVCMTEANTETEVTTWFSKNERIYKPNNRISIETIIFPRRIISILKKKDLTEEDFGYYECKSQIFNDTQISRFEVVSDESRTIDISFSEEVKKLKLNDSFEFNCSISDSTGKYNLFLYKNNYIIKTSKINSILYKIEAAGLDDAGLYECKGYDSSNFENELESKSLKIDIDIPNQLFVAKGSNFYLQCKKPFKQELLAESNNEFFRTRLDFSDFKNDYDCSTDKNNLFPVNILLVDDDGIKINVQLKNKTIFGAKINDEINQNCLAITNSASFPHNLVIEWYKPNGDLLEKSDVVDIQTYTIDTNPLTKISNLKIKILNLTSYGLYECRISYKYIIEALEFKISDPYDKIEPVLDKDSIECYQGDTVEVTCSSEDETEKEWLINGNNAEIFKNVEINANILIIKNVSLEMNGSISCRTVKDGILKSKTISCLVKIPPIVNIVSDKEILNDVIRIESGSNLRIECLGPFNESVKWLRDNELMNYNYDNGSIIFIDIQLENSGFYLCQSDNHKVRSKKIEIIVLEKIFTTVVPVTSNKIEKIIVTNGGSFEFENGIDLIVYCMTDEYKEDLSFSYIWITENQSSQNVKKDKNILKFKNFSEKSQGKFTCHYGSFLEKKIVLYLKVKNNTIVPTANIDPSFIELEYGQNTTIKCKVTGILTPKVYWFFKNELINNNQNFEISDNLLFIKNANENINGEITCQALGKDNVLVKAKSVIFVKNIRILVRIQPNELDIQIKSKISLSCEIIQPKIADISNLKYLWYKDNKILENFNLNQIEFTISSINQSGNYSCQVYDGDNKSDHAYFKIKVIQTLNDVDVNISSDNKIDYQNKILIAKERDNITLNCNSNAGDSQVYWNITTLNGQFEKNGKELVLNDIKQYSSGKYECVVKLPEFNKEFKNYINLTIFVYEPIKLKITKRYDNNILMLDCNLVQGLPHPEISWNKDGFKFHNIQEIKSPQMHSISIDQTNQANYGTFKCMAKNYFENVSEEFNLGPSQIEIKTTTEATTKLSRTSNYPAWSGNLSLSINSSVKYEIDIGSNIEITCNSLSHSNKNDLTFNWKKTHQEFESNVKSEGNLLKIENLNSKNGGKYECKIENTNKTKTESVILDLEVKRKHELPTAKIDTKVFDLEKKKSTRIVCYANGYPTPKINWLFNGKEIDDKNPNMYPSGKSLYVKNPNINLNGYITCQAIGSENNKAESSALLVYSYDLEPKVNLSVNTSNFTIGTLVQFNCTIMNKNKLWAQNFFYDWYKDGKLIETNSDQSYLVKLSSTSDSGYYSCQAKDSKDIQKSNKQEIFLQVYEKIEIKIKFESNFAINNKTIQIKQGDNVTVSCNTNQIKNQSIKTRWVTDKIFSDQKNFNVSSSSSFEINNADVKDSDKYICLANSNDSLVESVRDYINIKVERYEPIELFLEHELTESQVTVDCIYDGYPEPKVEWIKKVGSNSSVNFETEKILYGGIKLIVNRTNTNSIINFECMAQNTFESKSVSINLWMSNDPKILILNEQTTSASFYESTDKPFETNSKSKETTITDLTNEATTISISTTTTTTPPTATTTTTTNPPTTTTTTTTTPPPTTTTTTTTPPPTTTTTTTTPPTTTTTTTNTTPPKTTTTTTNTTTTTITTTSQATSITTTRVKYFTSSTAKKEIVTNDKTIYLNEGDNLDLECNLPDNKIKNMVYIWQRPEKPALPRNFFRDDELLKIRNFDSFNSGLYICSISTENETKTLNIKIIAKNQNELKIRFKKSYYELSDNKQAEISCNTYPISNETIEWFINEKNASDYKNLIVNGSKIFILNANQSLHGVITCRTKSKSGMTVEDTAVIRMNKKNTLYIDTYPKLSKPNIGDKITITCFLEPLKDNEVLGRIEYEWRKDRIPVRESNLLSIDRQGNLNLTITSLQDTGLYTCQAFSEDLKSNIGKVYVDVFDDKKEAIEIEIKSHKTIKEKKIYVKQSDSFTLECVIKSNEPIVQPKWYLIDGSLNSEHHLVSNNGSQITIKNIQPDHAGKYACYDYLKLNQIYSYVEVIVDKYTPINIYTEFSENEKNYIIECFVKDGYPFPQLEWIKAPNDLKNFSINQYAKSHIEILIEKNGIDIYGEYECRAENKYDSKSKIYKLGRKIETTSAEEISVDIPDEKIVLLEGSNRKIDCNLKGNQSLIKNIDWYLNETNINSNQLSNFKAFDNVLIINNIQINQKGKLKCVLRVDSISKSDSVILEVSENLKVDIEPKDPTHYEGDYLEFRCNIESDIYNLNPKNFKYTWYKSDKIIGNEQVLVLDRINLSSAGEYHCKVEKYRKARFSGSAKTKLIILSIPMTIGFLGENKTLECGLNSTNYMRYEWYKFSKQTETELEKERQIPSKNFLHLKNLKTEDRGDYICKAYYGDTVYDIKYIRIEVNKKEKPQLLISPSQEQIDSFGNYKSIKCEVVAGFPQPEIEWRRQDLKPMSGRVEIKNGVLSMKNINPYDYGEYECVAKNEFGEDLKKITINKPISLY